MVTGVGDDGPTGDLRDLPSLPARSVLLSLLLGTHPPELAVRHLVQAGEALGLAEGTVRVALSRLAADGDLVAADGRYRLAGRLVDRQRAQDEGLHPRPAPWDGTWELAVTGTRPRSPADRTALRTEFTALRLGALRDGVWARPANLTRPWPAALADLCDRFTGSPAGDPVALAGRLWDLDGWAGRARLLVAELARGGEPARRFVVAAAAYRHLRGDPLLPDGLVPADWPGAALRGELATHEREVARLVAGGRPSHPPGA